jgi:hypothetical protein
MIETVQTLLNEFAAHNSDRRLQLFDVKAESGEGDWVSLSGRILEEADYNELRIALESQVPGVQVDYAGVQVLRKAAPHVMTVSTNLTGLYAELGWQAEMLSQVFYGWKLEVLEERGNWAQVWMLDGYLGWVYLPYMTEHPAPDPTHLIVAPVSYVRAESSLSSQVVGRLLCGTAVQVVRWNGLYAEIDAQVWGWVTATDLRALEDMPKNIPERRAMLAADATRLMGVPYVEGGCTAMGIDSSGYSYLLHGLIGVRIPRPADLQYNTGRKVEYPYQAGDLLFFGEAGEKPCVSHVAVSLGGWRIIHSSRHRNGVYFDDVQDVPSLKESFLGACTFL